MAEPPQASAGLPTLAPDHGARSGQGSKTAAGGERVFALVLDREHAVIRSKSRGKPAFFLFFSLLWTLERCKHPTSSYEKKRNSA